MHRWDACVRRKTRGLKAVRRKNWGKGTKVDGSVEIGVNVHPKQFAQKNSYEAKKRMKDKRKLHLV